MTLYKHPSGKWAKKINGRFVYFGNWARQIHGVLTPVDNLQSAEEAALRAYAKYHYRSLIKSFKPACIEYIFKVWTLSNKRALLDFGAAIYALTLNREEVLYVGSTGKSVKERWITDSHKLLPLLSNPGIELYFTLADLDGELLEGNIDSRLRLEHLLISTIDPSLNKCYAVRRGR